MKWAFYVDSVNFARAVIEGQSSLGGSESSCLGLARGLVRRGHDVHIFATRLDEGCEGRDATGLIWHPAELVYELSQVAHWDVFCSLRMPQVFRQPIHAKLRILWNQDLMNAESYKHAVMATAWAYDRVAYVSEFHRAQWEACIPELKALGWVTKNGYDASLVPTDVVKRPNRIIHISRPERGLTPLLAMWPKLREQVPDAELAICRYSSMYDAGGWGQICAAYDAEVDRVNKAVGGITRLGELNKGDLYRAIAEAAVMWYPGVVDFAETSCVAAVESQACGTPFVGSFKGALPETVPNGVLISGDSASLEYQTASVGAVVELLHDCQRKAFRYRQLQNEGVRHVKGYTYDAIAAEWGTFVEAEFAERGENGFGVLRQLLHYDDHTAAKRVAEALCLWTEAQQAVQLCDRVIAGDDHTAEQYAERALPDPVEEWDSNQRFHEVAPWFEGCTNVLDVACGNGAFAIGLAHAFPHLRILAVDYAEGNILKAKEAAARVGVADRITFLQRAAWDFHTQQLPSPWIDDLVAEHGPFDGLFVGEFLEHVAAAKELIDALETQVQDGAVCVFTVPYGPFGEMVPRDIPHHRGHVHHFEQSDLAQVFGKKRDIALQFSHGGLSPRGSEVGNWLIRYTKETGRPTQARDYPSVIASTRPKFTLSVGIIAHNAEFDLGRCLNSVWPIADEIVVGDAGSTDKTRAIAETFGRRVKCIPVTPVHEHQDGFAGVRNELMAACAGDWFLWIDCDEILIGGMGLWKYLESGPFQGYSIHQNHLMIDSPTTFDRPIRLFRRRPDVQFYGCIHEQPQMGDCNTEITPALEIADVQIAHTGYITEGVRRYKMLDRNLPLLQKDQQRFGDRRLGKVLVLRDLVNLGDQERESAGGALTPKAKHCYAQAIGLFEKMWLNQFDDRHYHLARPFYENALRSGVAGVFEFEIGLAGKQHGLGEGRAKPERVWVRRLADIDPIVEHRTAQIHTQAQPFHVRIDPINAPSPTVKVAAGSGLVYSSVPVEAA